LKSSAEISFAGEGAIAMDGEESPCGTCPYRLEGGMGICGLMVIGETFSTGGREAHGDFEGTGAGLFAADGDSLSNGPFCKMVAF